jgi:hypothetical protein
MSLEETIRKKDDQIQRIRRREGREGREQIKSTRKEEMLNGRDMDL